MKAAQAGITDAQRRNVDYWAGGGVLRWNQVMRELVARYNLPPAPRADGTYPAPDATNPFADPQFPFANPPYAARAYAYVSVAQYEALKAAWYHKYLYNRPSPSQVEGGVAGPDARERGARLPVGRRRRLRGDRGDAEAALPGRGRGDHAEGRVAARGGPARRPGDCERRGRRARPRQRRRRRARGPRGSRRDEGGGGNTGAVGGTGRVRGGARRDRVEEPRGPPSPADARELRQGAGVDADPGRHRERARPRAAVHVVGADAARSWPR